MTDATRRVWFSDRLRLEAIGLHSVDDLFLLHQDDAVARWYGRCSADKIQELAARMAEGWAVAGVGKWLAYDQETGGLVGRGGLSRMNAGSSLACQVEATLAVSSSWAKDRLEVGWALVGSSWGQGYATELGTFALSFAHDELAVTDVVSFTERHNTRSRAVMERLDMTYVGEITGNALVDDGEEGLQPAPFALYHRTTSQRR